MSLQKIVLVLLITTGLNAKLFAMNPGEDLVDAIIKNDDAKLQQLLDTGIDINKPDNQGQTALVTAILLRRNVFINILLAHGADINLESLSCTPLIRAVLNNDTKLVELLLAHGADTTLTSNYGQTARMLATNQEIIDILDNAALRSEDAQIGTIMKLFKKHCMPLEIAFQIAQLTSPALQQTMSDTQSDAAGNTPLMMAAEQGRSALVEWWLFCGFDPLAQNNAGQTARDLVEARVPQKTDPLAERFKRIAQALQTAEMQQHFFAEINRVTAGIILVHGAHIHTGK